MTRGNQREKDREKAQKKLAQSNKPKQSGTSLTKQREDDAAKIKAKAEAKAALKAAGDTGGEQGNE